MNGISVRSIGLAAAGLLALGSFAFAASDVVVTEADSGKTFTLAPKQCLSVQLQTQAASTGYDWYMTANSTALMKLDGRAVTTPGTTDGVAVVGAPALDDFSLCAVAAGTGKVKFDYRRPWERGVKPAKTFEVKVKIGK
jgi:inhibitor of cysteine peptidase